MNLSEQIMLVSTYTKHYNHLLNEILEYKAGAKFAKDDLTLRLLYENTAETKRSELKHCGILLRKAQVRLERDIYDYEKWEEQ